MTLGPGISRGFFISQVLTMYTVDVIIPTYKPDDRFLTVIEKLRAQTQAPERIVARTLVSYDVFDMLGSHVGRVDAVNKQEASQKVRALVRCGGSYYVKSRSGTAFRLTVRD